MRIGFRPRLSEIVCSPLRCTSIFHHCVFFIIFVVVFTRIRAALARLLWFDESADEPSCCNTRWLQYSAHLYYSSESHCRVSGEHKCIAAHCASRGTAEVLHYSYCAFYTERVDGVSQFLTQCCGSWHRRCLISDREYYSYIVDSASTPNHCEIGPWIRPHIQY